MSCTRVRFPESTTTRRSVGDRFTVSAVTVTKGTPLGQRRNLDTRLSSRREEGALEEPDEDRFHRDDAHRDERISLLCDGSLDDRYRLVM